MRYFSTSGGSVSVIPGTIQTTTVKADNVESATTGTVLVKDDVEMEAGEQFFADAGTAAAPGVAFVKAGVRDPNTGLSNDVADTLMLSTGGAFRAYVNTSQISTPGATQFAPGGQLLFTGDISPTALTGDVTDYNPSGLSTAARVRVDPGAANRVINSLSGGADGRQFTLYNISTTQTLTLLHDDGATGTASMRFLCPNSVSLVIPVNGSRELEYDSGSSRWRVLGSVA